MRGRSRLATATSARPAWHGPRSRKKLAPLFAVCEVRLRGVAALPKIENTTNGGVDVSQSIVTEHVAGRDGERETKATRPPQRTTPPLDSIERTTDAASYMPTVDSLGAVCEVLLAPKFLTLLA